MALYLILLLAIASFSRSTNKTPWRHVFLVTAFAGVALYSSRRLPFFAIVAAPSVAQAVSGWLKEDFPKNPIWTIETNLNKINQSSNGLLWVFTVIIAVALIFRLNIPIDVTSKGNVFSPQFFPIEAVTWLEANPQSGHVFNEFD